MKTLTKIAVAVGLILGLVGCPKQRGIFENYPMEYNGHIITIYSTENKGFISFVDSIVDSDRRIDEISLKNVKEGDPLEKYASFEVGQKILDQFVDKK